jgi:Uma2 family endonuclease
MPAVITLDDLAAMISADTHGRRYETSPEGVLSVVPPPDSDHAITATRLMVWLVTAGWPPDQVLQVVGLRIPGPQGDGGRIPDLTVWSRRPASAVWQPVTDLVLVVEIVSPGSEAIDQLVKVAEYARAGITRYWTVARDEAQTVTLYELTAQGIYETVAQVPLESLLAKSPDEVMPSAAR